MSAAFRRLPRLVCGAVRARAALSGLRPAVRAPVAASWGEESINREGGGPRPPFFSWVQLQPHVPIYSQCSLFI